MRLTQAALVERLLLASRCMCRCFLGKKEFTETLVIQKRQKQDTDERNTYLAFFYNEFAK